MKQSTLTTILNLLDNEIKLANSTVYEIAAANNKEESRYWFDRLMKASEAKKDLQKALAISSIQLPVMQ